MSVDQNCVSVVKCERTFGTVCVYVRVHGKDGMVEADSVVVLQNRLDLSESRRRNQFEVRLLTNHRHLSHLIFNVIWRGVRRVPPLHISQFVEESGQNSGFMGVMGRVKFVESTATRNQPLLLSELSQPIWEDVVDLPQHGGLESGEVEHYSH